MSAALIYKIFVVILLFAVIISLSSGMFFLIRDDNESKRAVKSLTVRVALSITLFIVLLLGYFSGLIQPHGVYSEPPETEKALTR